MPLTVADEVPGAKWMGVQGCWAWAPEWRMANNITATVIASLIRILLSQCSAAFRTTGQGFTRTYNISYRGLRLPGFSAVLGRFYLRREVDLPCCRAAVSITGTDAPGFMPASLPSALGPG